MAAQVDALHSSDLFLAGCGKQEYSDFMIALFIFGARQAPDLSFSAGVICARPIGCN